MWKCLVKWKAIQEKRPARIKDRIRVAETKKIVLGKGLDSAEL